MDKHFAALTLPDSSAPDSKLTRAISYSELPTSRRILVEQCYESGNGNDPRIDAKTLLRQYSCEQIFDKNSNTRQIKVSELVRAGNEEHKNSWEATIPFFGTFRNATWSSKRLRDKPMAVESQCEDMEIEEVHDNTAGSLTFHSDKSKENRFELTDRLRCELVNKQVHSEKIIKDSKLMGNGNNARNSTDKKTDTTDLIYPVNTKFVERPNYLETKSKLRPLAGTQPGKNVEKGKPFFFWQMLFFLLFPVAILIMSISVNQDKFEYDSCDHDYDFSETGARLRDNIHGQVKAVQKLTEYFSTDSNELKTIAFIGGAGVGKSFAAQIISENFPIRRNIFQYVPPLQSDQRRASEILSLCGCNLIILENLGTKDILDSVNFVESIKIHAKNHCVTILAIFNMQETDHKLKHKLNLSKSSKEIEAAFREEKLDVKVIEFEFLNEEVLNKCIMEAAKERNLTLSKSEINYIRRGLLIADSGCKGAYAKVQLLVRE